MRESFLRYIFFILVSIFSAGSAFAQAEQDCFGSIPVCNGVYTQAASYVGFGNNQEVNITGTSCIVGGETNSVWYIFTVSTAGNLLFNITPVTFNDDYDWALYNISNATCADILTDPTLEVSCNYSATAGTTGIAAGGVGNVNGAGGPNTNAPLPVAVGQTYVLMINNFSSSADGYTLDLTPSTAGIFDNVAPTFAQAVSPSCGTDTIGVVFSEAVTCASVQAGDFTLIGPGGPYTVTAVSSNNCASGGTFDNNFTLTISPPLFQTGTYVVGVVGTVEDNCGNSVPLADTVQININTLTMTASAAPPSVCQGGSTTLSTSLSGVAGTSFVWSPGGSVSPNPVVQVFGPTTYTATATNPQGCIATASVNVSIAPPPVVTVTATPPNTCVGGLVTLSTNLTGVAGTIFSWSPGASSSPTPTVTINNTTTYTAYVVTAQGCIANGSVTVSLLPPPTSEFAYPNNICVGACNQVVYTGTASATATYSWDFDGGVICNGATGQGPYEIQWLQPGVYNICLSINDNGCASGQTCHQVTVLPNPIACISPIADQCLANNCFDFSYCGTPNVDAYYWTIPGGNPPASFVPNPSCVNYANAGLQTISMYVVDNGCVSAPVTANFNVIPDPVSQFMASATTICQGGDVNFSYTGAPVSANQSYLWSFPTGSPAISTLPNETVFFGSPGYYVVQLIVCNQFCCDTSTQTIFVSPGPQISAGIDRSFCAGDGPVMLLDTVLAGTGFAPYTYSWWCNAPLLCGITDPYVSHPMVNPGASPMTYYFQVTDNMGCRSNIDSTIVTVLEKPKVNAGPDQFICDAPTAPGAFLNGTVVNSAQVAGPYHYSWFCNTSPNCGMAVGSDTMPNPYVFPDQTTIYTLVVTAANGCSSDVTTLDTLSTTTVWVNETPIVDAGPTLGICYNASAILQGTLSGGGPNYTTIWTPNDAAAGLSNPAILNPTASPDFTTLFTLSVTSNGCTGTDTTSVVVHTLPTGSIDPPVADICQGDTICLNGLADGDPTGVQYTYSWSALGGGSGGILNPTSGVACFSPLTTTTYQVHVASPYCAGFLDDVLLQVNPTPTPSITTQDTLICEGTTIQLKSTYSFTGTPVAAPVLFQWSPDDGSILDATVQNPFVTPTQNTVYELTTSVAGQCPRKDKVYVEVIPFAPLVASADTTLICKDGTVQLNVAGGNPTQHYTWSPGMYLNDSSIQNPIASLTDTTTFTVTVNAGGCTATDNITIYVAPTPTADFYHTNVHGCDTLAVQFFENTTDDLAYIWNFGDNTPVSNEQNPYHNFTVPGSYTTTLTVIGAGGCSATASQGPFVVHDGSFAGFYSIPSINDSIFLPDARVQFTDTSTGAITWLWDFGDGNISTEPNPSHTYLNAGKYPVTLTVTNEYGCSNIVMQSPYLVIAPDLFVPNIFTPNGDGIHDTWELMYLGTEKIAIAVYDRWGKLMYEHNNLETLWDGKNQAKPCSEGVYFYSIKIGKKIYNGNVTILR